MTQLAATLIAFTSARFRAMRGQARDLGASALEWAIIAAVVVVAASVIGGVIFQIVEDKGTELERCANQPVGDAC